MAEVIVVEPSWGFVHWAVQVLPTQGTSKNDCGSTVSTEGCKYISGSRQVTNMESANSEDPLFVIFKCFASIVGLPFAYSLLYLQHQTGSRSRFTAVA